MEQSNTITNTNVNTTSTTTINNNTLDAIDELKRNQSSIRERVLARKKGIILDPLNVDTNVPVQEALVTPTSSPIKTPLSRINSKDNNIANINNNSNNYNNNNNITGKRPIDETDQPTRKHHRISSDDDIEKLLNQPSIKERERNKVGNELVELLERQSVKEKSLIEKFKTKGGPKVTEYCSHGTREDCKRERQKNSIAHCDKIHFRRIIKGHTDVALGDCSYLDTCRHMKTCKFVHYEIDDSVDPANASSSNNLLSSQSISDVTPNLEPQWICCDIRKLDMTLLGQFSVIMADPPWDIHMELPYGTMKDEEMKSLNVGPLQKTGYFFLWVTGRAMELGRECLQLWGYERVEEIIWVKTNQLQRIIRTGRTGHWLNHSKEHCLVGVKGNPGGNRFLDSDVIVAEVRETSRKPDEIYHIIERLSPSTRKLELFGRPHNSQPGWITLGNQLEGVRIHDPQMRERITKHLDELQ